MVYFRFLSAKKLTAPIMLAIATAAIMATSVVIRGVSGVTGVTGISGSTGVDAEAAGPTVTYVVADELP